MTSIGPQSPNFATVRPTTDAPVSGGVDTFFVDCSGPGVKDGTVVTASFLNILLVQLREAIRGRGITLDDADDNMLLKAINDTQHTHTAGAAPHADPTLGDTWFDLATSILFEYTNDGTNSIWLDTSS